MLAWRRQAGAFVPCDSIPLADRGFRYGMSVFESFRVIAGKPLFLTEHLECLRRACERLQFRAEPIAPEAVRETLPKLSGMARLYVTAGGGDFTAAITHPGVFLLLEEREKTAVAAYNLALDPEPHQPLFGGLKTANYWANLAAYSRARARGKEEAVLMDGKGCVLSASLANLFIVRGGEIETPASGARAGVLRAWVASRRPVRQRDLRLDDLAEAEEIFLASSWLGVMPAASLEDRRLPSRAAALALQAELNVQD